LVAAGLTAARDLPVGLILLAVFIVPNTIGYLLWRRQNLSCYAATQILVGLMGVSGLLTVYVLDREHLWLEIQTGASVSAVSAYYIVTFVVGILMLMFYFRFGRKDNGAAT